MGEIVQLKKTRMPRSRDAFYQAIPVNEIQGQFFYFGRNKIPDVELFKREKDKALNNIDALRKDRSFEILYDPRYGVPGPLAYRIWTGIEKFISDSGSNVERRLTLSGRQLAKLAGRSYAGKTAKEIAVAIRQLEESQIIYWHESAELKNDDGSPQIVEEKFAFIEKSSAVREDLDVAPHLYVITLPELVLGFVFHDRYFFCMSWDRVKDLAPQSQSVARILYRYMSYRYSKAKTENFRYTKDYNALCEEWFGGITPYTKRSEILRKHLAPRFDPVIEAGLLESYTVESNKAGDGFNVHFSPGKEFFTDFDSFYKKQLPLDFGKYHSRHDAHTGRPEINAQDASFALLAHFHERWFGDNAKREYLTAEIEFAQTILKTTQFEEAKNFVSWATERARETKFDMQTFGGLKQYFPKWQSERKREDERLQKAEAIREKEDAVIAEKLYEDFRQTEAQKIIDLMQDETRKELTQKATEQLRTKFPDTPKFLSGHVLSVERNLIADNLDLPDIESWQASRK